MPDRSGVRRRISQSLDCRRRECRADLRDLPGILSTAGEAGADVTGRTIDEEGHGGTSVPVESDVQSLPQCAREIRRDQPVVSPQYRRVACEMTYHPLQRVVAAARR